MYLLFGNKKIPKSLPSSAIKEASKALPLFTQDEQILSEIRKEDPNSYQQISYIYKNAHFPIYHNSETVYFGTGEENFECMLEELKKAKHFIFMEYFIINTGYMLDSIMSVLEQKVKEGVVVKLLYDDFGCLITLPEDFEEQMREKGIDCHAFNKLRPVLAIQMNNRDHRKIWGIDG